MGAPLATVLLVGVIVPGVILLAYSFFHYSNYEIRPALQFGWYKDIFTQPIYRIVLWNTLALALPTTLLSVAGGYVLAYYIAFVAKRSRNFLLLLIVGSLLASYLARVYAWRTLMGEHGIVNTVLQYARLVDQPIGWLLFSRIAVILAEINLIMPLTALICYASLSSVPDDLREASRDLGAGRVQTLFRITLPISGKAIFGSAALSFYLSSGDYVTPALLGGPTTSITFGTLIAQQIVTVGNYPLGAAISVVMVLSFLVYTLLLAAVLRAIGFAPRVR